MVRKYKKQALILSTAALIHAGCGGFGGDDDDDDDNTTSSTTSTTETATTSATEELAPTEDAVVTKATAELQLAGSLTVLPAKSGTSLAFADGTKMYSFALAEDRKLNLRMTNEAFQIIEQAGEIMCFLGQTKFWENAAASEAEATVYKARVDNKKCETSSGESGGGQNGSSGNQGPDLEDVFVKAWRVPERPLVAEFKVGGASADEPYYAVEVVVIEPPSDYAPAGIFRMNYSQTMGDQVLGGGFIYTQRKKVEEGENPKFVLSVGMDEQGEGRTNTTFGIAELSINESGDAVGFVNSESTGTEGSNSFSSKGKGRFNLTHLNVDFLSEYKSAEHSGEEKLLGCYNLNKFRTSIYRYDLLDANDQLVKLNSGFPIEYQSSGETAQGWAGYHGIWANGSELTSGTKVNKVDWSKGGEAPVKTEYTVFSSPGKLTKYTKASTTLGALKNVDLRLWDGSGEYIVKWNGTKFAKTAKISFGDKGMVEEAATGDVTIPEWGLNLRAEHLNADIRISKNDTLSDDLAISYHSQKLVSGTSDVPTCSLVCFSDCPVMAPAATSFSQSQDSSQGPGSSALYKTTTATFGTESYTSNRANDIQTALATYAWDATNQNLTEGGTAFALPSGLSSSSSEGGGGGGMMNIWSGPLVCTTDLPTDRTIDPYRLENQLTTFYRFESGAQVWNKFQGLKDSAGAFVQFDPPIQISYVHKTANDIDGNATNDGKSYRLEYGGPGELRIPWKYNADIGREMPEFNLKAGTAVGDYKAYPLEGEQRLVKETDESKCSELALAGIPALADLKSEGGEVKTVSLTWNGAEDTPIRYIGGVAVTQ